MKFAGFLLLPAGWGIVLSALAMFASAPLRIVFVLAGIAVEVLGLSLAARAHLVVGEERE